jgi:hypothetical protein
MDGGRCTERITERSDLGALMAMEANKRRYRLSVNKLAELPTINH